MTEEKVIFDSPEFLTAHVMSCFDAGNCLYLTNERRTREDEGREAC